MYLEKRCFPCHARAISIVLYVCRKQGIAVPFVFADISKFIPLWMSDDKAVAEEFDEPDYKDHNSEAVEGLEKALGFAAKPKKRTLSMARWVAAFDAYERIFH